MTKRDEPEPGVVDSLLTKIGLSPRKPPKAARFDGAPLNLEGALGADGGSSPGGSSTAASSNQHSGGRNPRGKGRGKGKGRGNQTNRGNNENNASQGNGRGGKGVPKLGSGN